jgi:poly(3-hydroxybutyrate) depolymerase
MPSDGGIPGGPVEPILPKAPANCPMLTTGFVTIASHNTQVQVQVWSGTKSDKPAPMLVYWHVTGGTSSEAVGGIGMPLAVATEITDAGGIIVSPQNSTGAGNDTGNSVWFTGDFDVADQLVACAMQQYTIDPRRIYTAGGSAGALQAGTMVYERSNYIAASMPNSGGYATGGRRFQNPNHITPVITVHGAPGLDVVIVDFSQQSLFLAGDVAMHGGMAVDCDHGGGHVGAGDDVKNAAWQFFKDHPFGVSPEPYAKGLPADFPAYCKIITAADAIANPDPLDMPDAAYE